MISDVEKYLINEKMSIKDALIKVDENHFGFILSCNDEGRVLGLATDGDIRRGMIKGIKIDDPIAKCANADFMWAQDNISREKLIKHLDSHIKFIPILDDCGKLTAVLSRDYLPLQAEQAVYIRSRAPVRVSFGGGGSDLTHYFSDNAGAVINAAISIYSHGVMRVRNDSKIIISSLDLAETLTANDLKDAISQKGSFGLIQSLLHVVEPKYGFELCLHSDFPVGSGLGGSATISAVVLGCFNMLRSDQWNQYEIAEIAFQAERLHLGIAGGWQDQYAAVFGGFNFIEFNADENIVNPIRIQPDVAMELEESLILCDTGIAHHSGNIHDDQRETMNSEGVREMVKENVKLTYAARNYLLRGDLGKFGKCLDETWKLKRNFSSMITNDHIDSIYDGALRNGAIGGKLLGAGGGGYFLFYVPPFEKFRLINYLESKNLTTQPFRFEPQGLRSWTSRASTNKSVNGDYQ
jgi:D-glycero-alpha-D-manno-heptose-7-phosphate kinase